MAGIAAPAEPEHTRVEMNIRRYRPSRDQLSGLVILSSILLALIVANSSLADLYAAIHHAPVRIGIAPMVLDEPLITWINDGLMTLFFLLIGLEIKRELIDGHLSSIRRAALPVVAAFGGMLVPAIVYLAITWGDGETMRGWAIPTATDIALALGALSLLGNRVPVGLKVFLIALAIFDDLGAITIIAVFYSEELRAYPLAVAALIYLALVALNRVNHAGPLVLVGLGPFLWLFMFEAGIEASLAGVLIASVVPHRIQPGAHWSPLRRTERAIEPWSHLLIVPIFGFFNAGVTIDATAFANIASPVSLGVFAGLFFGKQMGVFGAAWCAVRLGIGQLPPKVSLAHIYGASLLAGVGFTMGLFVTALAFESALLAESARLAILAGSSASAVAGLAVLWRLRS